MPNRSASWFSLSPLVVTVPDSIPLSPAIGYAALAAFPAMILGGLDSPGGAIVGGVLIGVAEVMTRRYLDFDWLGADFASVLPYLILILVLLGYIPRGF